MLSVAIIHCNQHATDRQRYRFPFKTFWPILDSDTMNPYPDIPTERTRWILERRNPELRVAVSAERPAGWDIGEEPDGSGGVVRVLTAFLTNRECPWRCLMCDLWRYTLETTVPVGAIPGQIGQVLKESAAAGHQADWIKLYNAGSFFDPGAIPREDYPEVARLCRGFRRVIVECHPSLVNERILAFRDLLAPGTRLEVAMGLETAHPEVLHRLNKRMRLQDFTGAAAFLRHHDIALRNFVLVRPPFLDEEEALEWACRTIDFAFDCGSEVVSLIPTRLGNGALEELARQGLFAPPRIETLAAAHKYGLELLRGRVLADLWDLTKFVRGTELGRWEKQLGLWNLAQEPIGPQRSGVDT